MIIAYLPRTKSRRPDGTEVPRTSLRELNDPVRSRLQIVIDYAQRHNMTIRQVLEYLG